MDNDKYIGRLLDNRYEILDVLGTGGMAVVYKARCHRLNRLVAIKILKEDNFKDEDFRRRFHAESQAVAMLSHPNIVSIYDVSTTPIADYIVMELIEGITLKQYMEKKGVLNWKETLHFAIQIAKALEHAHSKGIVHRDIKPHNVMVLKNGSVKVMDFGIARLISRGNTLTKEALGSVHYISPEQAKGGRVDNRSDIYSLGVVMYEMMAGRPPYDGDSPVSVAIQHINGGAVMPSVINPNIPGGLEQIIMKAMAHNVSNRYLTATEMLADMDEFRKDPTVLFDYTGLPLDAALRVQKLQSSMRPLTSGEKQPQKQTVPQGEKLPPISSGSSRVKREEPHQKPQQRKRKRRKTREEKRSRVATIAIILCSLVAVIAIGIFMAILLGGGFTPAEKLFKVPELKGKVFTDLPEYPNLTIIKEPEYSDSVAAGVVISQRPNAGDEVVDGALVVVRVSLGPKPNVLKMPDFKERSLEWAVAFLQIQNMEFKISMKEENNTQIAKGHVIRTTPEKNAELSEGEKIELVVSLGKPMQFSSMPNVINKEMVNAIGMLDALSLDLQIVIEETFHFSVEAGCVIDSEPAKGERLTTGQKVTLQVSKGVEKKVMPAMVGMQFTAAKELLAIIGFKEPTIVEVYSDEPEGTVLSQNQAKGQEYDIDVEIILEVSKGPEWFTKDVVIDLLGYAVEEDCEVTVTLDEFEVFRETVAAGTLFIIVPGQYGTGMVTYTVTVNGGINWEVVEFFVAEA